MNKFIIRASVLFCWVISVIIIFALLNRTNMDDRFKAALMVIYWLGSFLFAIDIDSKDDEKDN